MQKFQCSSSPSLYPPLLPPAVSWPGAALVPGNTFTLHLHPVWAQMQGGSFHYHRELEAVLLLCSRDGKQAHLFPWNCICFRGRKLLPKEGWSLDFFFLYTSLKRRKVSERASSELLKRPVGVECPPTNRDDGLHMTLITTGFAADAAA